MLAVTDTRVALSSPSMNGGLSASSRRVGDQLRALVERQVLGDHDELVAAEATERVPAADHAVQSRCHRAQKLIADAVAEGVVDRP